MTSALVMNIEGVRRSKDAENRIREERPDMVAFLQAYRARPWLMLMARKHDYYRHHLTGEQERKNICLFLRKGLIVLEVQPMHMEERWVGGKAGRPHAPRTYWRVTTKTGQTVSKTVFVHLPTDNANEAQAESVDRLVAYRNRNKTFDVQFMGDFNKDAHEMKIVVERLDGELHTVGKVDHAVFCRDDHPQKGSEFHARSDSYRDEPGKMQPGAHGWGIHRWWREQKS